MGELGPESVEEGKPSTEEVKEKAYPTPLSFEAAAYFLKSLDDGADTRSLLLQGKMAEVEAIRSTPKYQLHERIQGILSEVDVANRRDVVVPLSKSEYKIIESSVQEKIPATRDQSSVNFLTAKGRLDYLRRQFDSAQGKDRPSLLGKLKGLIRKPQRPQS